MSNPFQYGPSRAVNLIGQLISENENAWKYILGDFPVIGPITRAYDNWSYINDYLENRGLTWDDIKYPTRLGSMGAYGAVSYVSSNIEKLYGSDKPAVDKEVRRRLKWAYGVW